MSRVAARIESTHSGEVAVGKAAVGLPVAVVNPIRGFESHPSPPSLFFNTQDYGQSALTNENSTKQV
jgi:hypothetical protein